MLARVASFLAQPPTSRRLAGMRIALGLVGVAAYVPSLPQFFFIYGRDGVAAGANLLPWDLHDGVQVAVVALLLSGSLAMICGLTPRAATVVVWLTHSWMWLSNSTFYWSWGLLFSNFLFFLMLCLFDRHVSRLGPGVAFWFRMFQVQVCFVYLLTSLYRYDSEPWWLGESFHIAMADTVFGRFTFLDWYRYYPWIAPLTYGAFVLEWMAGLFLLFHKRLGPYLVVALMGFHVTLELTSMLQAWQFLMMAALVAFWPESWLARLDARWPARGDAQHQPATSAPESAAGPVVMVRPQSQTGGERLAHASRAPAVDPSAPALHPECERPRALAWWPSHHRPPSPGANAPDDPGVVAPDPAAPKHRLFAVAFILLWMTVLIPNLPIEWSETYVGAARTSLFPMHALLGLSGNYGMRMFTRPSRRGAACMIAVGFRDGGFGSRLLFPPPVKDCLDRGVRLWQNATHHALYKYYATLILPGSRYRVYRKGKTPQQAQRDLGEMFCQRSRADGRPEDRVFVGLFRETYEPVYSTIRQGGALSRRPELRTGLGYDCHRHALVPIDGHTVLSALTQDHPALYAVFHDYETESAGERRADLAR